LTAHVNSDQISPNYWRASVGQCRNRDAAKSAPAWEDGSVRLGPGIGSRAALGGARRPAGPGALLPARVLLTRFRVSSGPGGRKCFSWGERTSEFRAPARISCPLPIHFRPPSGRTRPCRRVPVVRRSAPGRLELAALERLVRHGLASPPSVGSRQNRAPLAPVSYSASRSVNAFRTVRSERPVALARASSL
jgi:hypothetical protein